MTALWDWETCLPVQSGDMSPHSTWATARGGGWRVPGHVYMVCQDYPSFILASVCGGF